MAQSEKSEPHPFSHGILDENPYLASSEFCEIVAAPVDELHWDWADWLCAAFFVAHCLPGLACLSLAFAQAISDALPLWMQWMIAGFAEWLEQWLFAYLIGGVMLVSLVGTITVWLFGLGAISAWLRRKAWSTRLRLTGSELCALRIDV